MIFEFFYPKRVYTILSDGTFFRLLLLIDLPSHPCCWQGRQSPPCAGFLASGDRSYQRKAKQNGIARGAGTRYSRFCEQDNIVRRATFLLFSRTCSCLCLAEQDTALPLMAGRFLFCGCLSGGFCLCLCALTATVSRPVRLKVVNMTHQLPASPE